MGNYISLKPLKKKKKKKSILNPKVCSLNVWEFFALPRTGPEFHKTGPWINFRTGFMKLTHCYPSQRLQWWACENGHWLHYPGREMPGPERRKWWGRSHPKAYIQGVCLEQSHTCLPTAHWRQQSQMQIPIQAKDPGPGVLATCSHQVPRVSAARSLLARSSEGKEVPTCPSLLPCSVTGQSAGERERGGKERREEKSMQRPVGK